MRNGREYPNIDSGLLRDTDNWQPYGVEFPFFWAFEELEKKCLRDSFQSSWWERINMGRRLKKYIPYPKPHYELPKAEKNAE